MNSRPTYKPGDIVYYEYAYSSRFPVFYQITKVTDKSVFVAPIDKIRYGYTLGGGSYQAIPDASKPGRVKRLSIRPNGYAYITYYGHLERLDIWNGSPISCYSD